jgi:hypothetical protein
VDPNQFNHEFLWRVLEGALGTEKVAYLRHAPLHEIVLNKMAQDYPDQDLPDYVSLPHAARHITETSAPTCSRREASRVSWPCASAWSSSRETRKWRPCSKSMTAS